MDKTKAHLMYIRSAEAEARDMDKIIKCLYAHAAYPARQDGQSTREPDARVGGGASLIADYKDKAALQWQEVKRLKADAEVMLSRMADRRHASLLRRRYLVGQGWDEIATEMAYSISYVMQMHHDALEALSKLSSKK